MNFYLIGQKDEKIELWMSPTNLLDLMLVRSLSKR
jgi:hypothetical protein